MVFSCDASLSGWGVARSLWSSKEVAEVGRVSERSRFRRGVGLPARGHALSAAGFEYDEETRRWAAEAARHHGGELDEQSLLSAARESCRWEEVEDFPEVPQSCWTDGSGSSC